MLLLSVLSTNVAVRDGNIQVTLLSGGSWGTWNYWLLQTVILKRMLSHEGSGIATFCIWELVWLSG